MLLAGLPGWADDVVTVKVGDADIKLCCPPGMVEIPKDDPNVKAIADLTPPNCQSLRCSVTAAALDTTKAPDPDADIMFSQTVAMKDVLMDVDSGSFHRHRGAGGVPGVAWHSHIGKFGI